MEQDKIKASCENPQPKQGTYHLEQGSVPSGWFRFGSICQPWLRPSLVFPSILATRLPWWWLQCLWEVCCKTPPTRLAFPGNPEPFAAGSNTTVALPLPSAPTRGTAWPPTHPSHTIASMQGPRAQPLFSSLQSHTTCYSPTKCWGVSPGEPQGCPNLMCILLLLLYPQGKKKKEEWLQRRATNCKLPGRLRCQTNIFLFTTEHKYLAAHLI